MGVGFNGDMLAVFTAMTPSGAAAFVMLGVVVILLGLRKSDPGVEELRQRLDHALAMPLLVAWVGFISAATHLGMPSNALFVVDGIGRSPLSDEVAAAVGFLFFSGVYWLYTFKVAPRRAVANALLVPSVAFAVGLVVLSAKAYEISTVPTWCSWHVPAGMVLSAITGGAALAASVTEWVDPGRKGRLALLMGLGLVSLAASALVAWQQWEWLHEVSNYVVCAVDAVPGYPAAIGVRLFLGLAGFVLLGVGAALGKEGAGRASIARLALVGASLFVLMAVLALRLPFYDLHMTVGF